MHHPQKVFLYADIIRRLGIRNVGYVAWYRFSIKAGIRKLIFLHRDFVENATFFHPVTLRSDYPAVWNSPLLADAEKILQGRLRYYGYHWKQVGSPPKWFLNPFNGTSYPSADAHWTKLPDFHPTVGDIKNVWEASRFEWAVTLARAYRACGNVRYLETLNQWLANWCRNNPLNTGPNWKCGQEASIRIFNLFQVGLILDQWKTSTHSLIDLIQRHLERIHGNIRYAIAQDNNHGTSEAAALFIGGHWLAQLTSSSQVSRRSTFYARQGRKWIEERVQKLVETDGSFSQHSVTYHRLLLHTLVLVEFWRKKLEVDPFSAMFYKRANSVIDWLTMLIDPKSGMAPNLGANDGSLLLNTHSCDYRDFRPTLQTATVLFQNKNYFGFNFWDEPLYWLGLHNRNTEKIDLVKLNKVLPGGYVILAGKNSWGLIRFPMFRFRPSHNDVFHFDLWWNGQNICRDAGSYSYNSGNAEDDGYFKSVKAHNTVAFDDHEQMPRLGRFMLGKWIKPEHVGRIKPDNNGGYRWSGAYKDYRGNHHQRTVFWRQDLWRIEDRLSGPFQEVQIRYRLLPGRYTVEGNRVIASWGVIEIEACDCTVSMTKGYESLYYWEKKPVDVLTVSVGRTNCRVATRFVFE